MADEILVDRENAEKTPENSKRKLEKTVLDNFSKLVNTHEQVRIKSAANLLKYLVEKDEKPNDSNELKYALKRLVRGLGSSPSTARIGYFTTLVGLLSIEDNIAVSEILELIKSELHKSAKNSQGENADIFIGQILTCGAIIKSNLWKKCEEIHKKEIIETIITAGKARVYLTVVSNSFLIELFSQVTEKEFKKLIFPQLRQEIEKPWTEQNLDTLYFLLTLKSKFPKICNTEFLQSFLETPDIISNESLGSVSNILMTVLRVTSIKHPVYENIIKDLDPEITINLFVKLDDHLRNPNRNRLLVFIQILTNVYLDMSKNNKEMFFDCIPELLTPNFVRQLVAYFQTLTGKMKDKQFKQMVDKLFETLLNVLKLEKVESKTKILVLKKFLFKPGTFIFEKRTKSKIIQQITLTLNSKGVKKLAKVYRGVTEGSEKINSDEHWLNNDRLYSAHLLIKLLSHPNMKTENEWKVDQLTFLMSVSMFREENGINIGRELAESLKTAFFGALDLKLSKLEELHSILSKLVENLNSKINPQNLETILRTPLKIEAYELLQKTLNVVQKIERKKNKKGGLKAVFLTMFLHMSLQLFNDVKLATESLNELHNCYKRIKHDKKTKHNLEDTHNQSGVPEDTQNDPEWIEVVTDLFLNLLSHNSHLLRSIINCVFPHLCSHMTSNTVHQIVSVLDPENEDPLSKDGEEEDEDDSEESEKEGEEDELKTDNIDAENDTDENDSDNDSSDDKDDNTDTNANDKLRMALHQAMMTMHQNGDGKMAESDLESIDLDNMSDSEGDKLDKALADAFKQFKPNHGRKRKQSKDQETLTHFRIRVLDLVEIYLDSNPPMTLALEIMLPLLKSVEFSIRDAHQKPLNDRLKGVLKKLLNLKKFDDTEGVTADILVGLFRSLLEKGTKNMIIIQEMGEQISDCCIFVIKCSEILSAKENFSKKEKKHLKNQILEVISGEIYNFFNRRDCLTPYVLFKNILNLTWTGTLGIVPILLEYLFSEDIKQFKKNQVSELLKIFYSNQRFLTVNKETIEKKLVEYHGTFFEKIRQFFKDLLNENSEQNKNIKERFICNVLNLLASMKHSGLNFEIDWKELGELVKEYRSYKSFSKDAKLAYNKFCKSIGVSPVVKMKNNLTKISEKDEIELGETQPKENGISKKDKKKEKRKLNKEKLKLKKQAKKLRLEGLSEGFKVQNEDILKMNGDSNMDIIDNQTSDEEEKSSSGILKQNGHAEEEEQISDMTQTNKEKLKKKKRHTMGEEFLTNKKKRKVSL